MVAWVLWLGLGQKFEDLAAFESAIMRYQNAENVQFYRCDSRSVDKAQPRLEKKLNPKIKYYEVISQQRLRVHFRTASMTLTHYDNTSVQYTSSMAVKKTIFSRIFRISIFSSFFFVLNMD